MTNEDDIIEAKSEITRLRERLAEADEANRRVSDENETLRRDVKTAVMGDSAELQDVKRENEKLREALRPFAELAVAVERQYENCLPSEKHLAGVRYGDLRAAAAAIRESGDE